MRDSSEYHKRRLSDQTRTHNAANEITGITEGGGQVAWATPVQDVMGNVTSYPKPSSLTNSYTCKYDAWNRLVQVKDGETVVADYVYDGLGRRITKKTYVSGTLDKTRQFFYTNQWQDIEERVDERTNDLERQHVWGIGYVDELVLRDKDTADDGTLDQRHYALQDANYSLTCIVDTNGDAQERYLYTPYGARAIFDGGFSSIGSSAYDWNIGHQGLMHDTESSLVYNRKRMLHPGLGRFMQRDPLGYQDAANLYEYVRSAPQQFQDPSGEAISHADCEKQANQMLACGRAKHIAKLLKKGGCQMPEFKCVDCTFSGGGYYDTTKNVFYICQNNITNVDYIKIVVPHELVHAYDNCILKDPFPTEDDHACSEIRASIYDFSCKGRTGKEYEDCVKNRAKESMRLAGQDPRAVDWNWERCRFHSTLSDPTYIPTIPVMPEGPPGKPGMK